MLAKLAACRAPRSRRNAPMPAASIDLHGDGNMSARRPCACACGCSGAPHARTPASTVASVGPRPGPAGRAELSFCPFLPHREQLNEETRGYYSYHILL
jgi:hypothetical protein